MERLIKSDKRRALAKSCSWYLITKSKMNFQVMRIYKTNIVTDKLEATFWYSFVQISLRKNLHCNQYTYKILFINLINTAKLCWTVKSETVAVVANKTSA